MHGIARSHQYLSALHIPATQNWNKTMGDNKNLKGALWYVRRENIQSKKL